MWRRAELASPSSSAWLLLRGRGGHEALNIEDEFVKGVFSPSFTPPPRRDL
jgi:hypothetical protein